MIRASQRLYRERPNGRRELAYNVGDVVSEEDAIALGLTDAPKKAGSPERSEEPEEPKQTKRAKS